MPRTEAALSFKEIVTGRRSIRKYDSTVKISKEEMTDILEQATRAPSSMNLQPWRFVVIESAEGKAALAPLAKFNQLQVETSAAMIAIFGDLQSNKYAEKIYGAAVKRGLMAEEVKDRQINMISNVFNNLTVEANREMVILDAGFVSMQIMLAARAHGYETNPIGGFDKQNITETLGLDKERYFPIMLLSVGKAAEEGYTTVRLPVEDVATWK